MSVTAVGVVLIAGGGVEAATADPDVAIGDRCPALFVFGVQGPDESAPDTAPTLDTGALGQLFTPLATHAGDLIQRLYIPYGHDDTGEPETYDQATTSAAHRLESETSEVVHRCPATKIAVAGWGQGAAAVTDFARRVGDNSATVEADSIAGIALLANPSRAGSEVLPGRPGQTTPAPAPGTTGAAVASIHFANTSGGGRGIDPSVTGSAGFGTLAGRVADLCTPGDLACDAPAGSPLTQTVKNIAAQSNLGDPVAAISTIAQALAATIWKTAIGVVTDDIAGNSLDELSYRPAKPLGQRLAEASDPNTPMPGPDDALAALFRTGTIGLNTVVSVAQKVFTPATIAELATVGMANPAAALGVLGTKLAGAVADLVPPHTALGWVNQAFDAITSTITDDNQLYQLATYTQYSDTAGHHAAYTSTPATPTGTPALAAVADWFTALAHDLAATHPNAATPLPPTTTTTEPAASTTPGSAPERTGTAPPHSAVPSPSTPSAETVSLRQRDQFVPRGPTPPKGPATRPSTSRR
ncbi:cutinase family protein [Nocardia elegans]|uniref:cutinase family protein n=1 Tax=Nocardia elegans TaxID=300029 RepID=UPI001895E414|nr:cutinase family protein [Nocardia elegans]MBF6245796.1 cutinase family protein [Nocardia elegans]